MSTVLTLTRHAHAKPSTITTLAPGATTEDIERHAIGMLAEVSRYYPFRPLAVRREPGLFEDTDTGAVVRVFIL